MGGCESKGVARVGGGVVTPLTCPIFTQSQYKRFVPSNAHNTYMHNTSVYLFYSVY